MKLFFLITCCAFNILAVNAQLKTTAVCPLFKVDVLNGTLNDDLNPKSTLGEIKTFFPCYSEILEEATNNRCAGIFYKDKDINFLYQQQLY